ncbi:MAG: hypothetical protein QM489_07190 [Candidatus Izemoplasma sp.]
MINKLIKPKEEIANNLSVLIGSKITRITHVADLIVLEFTKNGNEYGIHSQTFVRFIKNKKILFTRNDYYTSSTNKDDSSPSNFELKNAKYSNDILNRELLFININEVGDISLSFAENIVIEVIIDTSKDYFDEQNELWRFFKYASSNPHFVVYDDLIINYE